MAPQIQICVSARCNEITKEIRNAAKAVRLHGDGECAEFKAQRAEFGGAARALRGAPMRSVRENEGEPRLVTAHRRYAVRVGAVRKE